MARKPIIVITAGRQNLYTPRRESQSVWTGCDVNYVKSILRSGGTPMLLPFLVDRDSVRAALGTADGLLLTGGGDVIPLAYGEEPHPKSIYQDPVRDEMEFEVVRLAVEMGLPVLGICRGIQVLNVALGGTLVQDIPSQVSDAIKHSGGELGPALTHSVDMDQDSLIARVFGTTTMPVNSWHHQAVKGLGRGLKVTCRARDGVVEGLESDEGKRVLAVQYHPEEIAADFPQFQKLFDWLVSEARCRS